MAQITKTITLLIAHISIIFSLACCTPPSYITSPDDDPTDPDISSIAYLKGLYTSNTYYISSDIIIEGTVTANDTYGELSSSIVIEDSSGAIEIMCDIEDCITSGFVVGATVRALCSGLYLGSTGGMLSLGGAPDNDYTTTTLDEEQIALHLQIRSNEIVEPTATQVTIPELNTTHILRYVVVTGLSFVLTPDSPTTFCTRNEDTGQTEYTTHTLTDSNSNQIYLSVSSGVTYADENLPTGEITLYAIVEYFNGEYRLRIVKCGYI